MKKILFLVLFCFSFTVTAENEVKPIRVFEFKKESGWKAFQTTLLPQIMVEEEVSVYGLGKLGYKYALDNGYLSLVRPEDRNERNYSTAFAAFNLLIQREKIPVKELREIGLGIGLFLPIDYDWLETQRPVATNAELQSSVATGAPAVTTEGEKSSAATTPAEMTKPEDLQTQALEMLNNQFDRSKKEVERLQGELAVLKRSAGAVTTNTNKIEALEEINSGILERLEALKGSQNATAKEQINLANLLKDLGGVIDGQRQETANLKQEMEARIKKVETSVSEQETKVSNIFWWLVALSAVVAVLTTLIWRLWRHNKVSLLNNQKNSQSIVQVESDLLDIKANQLQVEKISDEDKQKVSKESLAQLRKGDKVEISPTIFGGKKRKTITITVEVIDDKFITVTGIPRDEKDRAGAEHKVFRNTDILKMFFHAVEKGYYNPSALRVA